MCGLRVYGRNKKMIDIATLAGMGVVGILCGLGLGWLFFKSIPEAEDTEQEEIEEQIPGAPPVEEEQGLPEIPEEEPEEEPELPEEEEIPEEPPKEIERKRVEYTIPDGEFGYAYIEYPETVPKNTKFGFKFGWVSKIDGEIEYKGYIQRSNYYQPIRDRWRGLLWIEDGETESVTVNRGYTCKGGIDKDTSFLFRLSIYDGENFNQVDERRIKVKVEK